MWTDVHCSSLCGLRLWSVLQWGGQRTSRKLELLGCADGKLLSSVDNILFFCSEHGINVVSGALVPGRCQSTFIYLFILITVIRQDDWKIWLAYGHVWLGSWPCCIPWWLIYVSRIAIRRWCFGSDQNFYGQLRDFMR